MRKFLSTFLDSRIRGPIFSRTTTVGTTDSNPNTLLSATQPNAAPTGQEATSGNYEGAPFMMPDWYHPHPTKVGLACAETTGGTSTVTVNVWILCTQANTPNATYSTKNNGAWVLVETAVVVTEKTMTFLTTPFAAYYQVYIQITAVSNTPTGLFGWAMTN